MCNLSNHGPNISVTVGFLIAESASSTLSVTVAL